MQKESVTNLQAKLQQAAYKYDEEPERDEVDIDNPSDMNVAKPRVSERRSRIRRGIVNGLKLFERTFLWFETPQFKE